MQDNFFVKELSDTPVNMKIMKKSKKLVAETPLTALPSSSGDINAVNVNFDKDKADLNTAIKQAEN